VFVALVFAGALSGCNTVKGLGQDFQALGDAVKQTFSGK
jgi:predicted small secreted protein